MRYNWSASCLFCIVSLYNKSKIIVCFLFIKVKISWSVRRSRTKINLRAPDSDFKQFLVHFFEQWKARRPRVTFSLKPQGVLYMWNSRAINLLQKERTNRWKKNWITCYWNHVVSSNTPNLIYILLQIFCVLISWLSCDVLSRDLKDHVLCKITTLNSRGLSVQACIFL